MFDRIWPRSWRGWAAYGGVAYLSLAALLGAAGGLGLFTFGYAEGASYLSNDPQACQTCHNVPESELRDKVATIQGRTRHMIDLSAAAMVDMLDAIREAKAAGASEEQLAPLYELQKKAMWRLDFISSENSLGFHADQEAVRILGESIDFSRQAQALANRIRAPEAPVAQTEAEPVRGVTGRKP